VTKLVAKQVPSIDSCHAKSSSDAVMPQEEQAVARCALDAAGQTQFDARLHEMTKLTFFFAFIVLSACSLGSKEPTVIDGSSVAAFERTLGDAKGELGPRDRIKFEAALAEFRAQMFAKAARGRSISGLCAGA
jgi:hypothetical protein